MKTIYLILIVSFSMFFASCSENEADVTNYLFKMNLNTELGTSANISEVLKIGITVDSTDFKNNAQYTTKIYSSLPNKSTILVDEKVIDSTNRFSHDYNNNTLYFKFIADEEGEYWLTIEVSNGKHIEKKTLLITISSIIYNISLSCDETQGTVLGQGKYAEGTTIKVEATPKHGYNFDGWYSLGSKITMNNPFTFLSKEDRILEARFVKSIFNVKSDIQGDGTVIGQGDYPSGSQVTLVAKPEVNSKFLGFYNERDVLITVDETYNFSISSDTKVVAKFIKNVYVQLTLDLFDPHAGGCTNNGLVYKIAKFRLSTFTKWGNSLVPYTFTDEYLDVILGIKFKFSAFIGRPMSKWSCDNNLVTIEPKAYSIKDISSIRYDLFNYQKSDALEVFFGEFVSFENVKLSKSISKDGRDIILIREVRVLDSIFMIPV
ncbi:MAG: hypothetical protein RL662_2177 [Bacteroidota bacterium]|jgi:hypothetical protein